MSNKGYVALILAVGLLLPIGCFEPVSAMEETVNMANTSLRAPSNATELISFV